MPKSIGASETRLALISRHSAELVNAKFCIQMYRCGTCQHFQGPCFRHELGLIYFSCVFPLGFQVSSQQPKTHQLIDYLIAHLLIEHLQYIYHMEKIQNIVTLPNHD